MVRVLKFGRTPKRVINIGTTAQTEKSLSNNYNNFFLNTIVVTIIIITIIIITFLFLFSLDWIGR